jgi:hypothetical protein
LGFLKNRKGGKERKDLSKKIRAIRIICGKYPMLTGKATPAGTEACAKQYSTLSYNPLSDTRLLVSQVGFGCYRVEKGIESHEIALRHALLNGINLIDTSANYGDGRSEELVGQVLQELVDGNQLTRKSVVVVSKAGYLQGQNLQIAQERKQEGWKRWISICYTTRSII